MRVLAIGHHNALGDLYLRLMARGHEVRVFIADSEAYDILEGLIVRTVDWWDDLDWVRTAPDLGFILFESTGFGAVQDELRREGFRVFGGSAFGDRLELERSFGQQVAAELGMRTAETFAFDSFERGLTFLDERPGRYVLKFDGEGLAKSRNYVGALDDGEDMRAMLRMQASQWGLPQKPCYVLMQHLSGVEVGVGGFFDGTHFLHPVNLD